MTLFINTTDSDIAHIALIDGRKVISKKWKVKRELSETLVSNLEKLFKSKKTNFQELKKIVVILGPGHFSRVRTGVVFANALSYALNIPVVGIKANKIPNDLLKLNKLKGKKQIIMPFYKKPPNITKPKKRKSLTRTP